MKFGMRKPSLKKSIKARTTGKWKRQLKRSINPFYGKRGMGWLHPKRALYNRVYRRTTFSVFDVLKLFGGSRRRRSASKKTVTVQPRVDWAAVRADIEWRTQQLTPPYRYKLETQYSAVEIPKNKVVALCWLTGLVGGHRFYIHDYLQGLFMALFFLYFGVWNAHWWGCIWWAIDIAIIGSRIDRGNLTAKRAILSQIEDEALEAILSFPEIKPATATAMDGGAMRQDAAQSGGTSAAIPVADTAAPRQEAAPDETSSAHVAALRQNTASLGGTTAAAYMPEAAPVPSHGGIERFYPPDTEKFSMNTDEKTFFRNLYLQFAALSCPGVLTANRMSDGTLNFCYDGKQVGRIRLQKRKHFMQILTREDVTILDGELPLFLNNLPQWMSYIRDLAEN